MIGRRLGRYELLGKLGGGGMGEVFLARRVSAAGVGKPVVVKVVHRRHARNEALRAMFLDEARLAAAVRHPNVAAVEDLGEEGDELFMVIEHVPGASLAQVLAKLHTLGRRMLPGLSTALASDAALGLHAAHEARDELGRPLNIVHRDVSPHNVLLGTQGQVKVIDFGVAKASQRLQRTTGRELKGKLRYMAPEQLDGEVDARTDVFALGVVLWEMLTAQRLFGDPDDATVIRRILAGDLPRPSSLATVTPALDACVMRALAKRADERFPSADALATAIREACPEHAEAEPFARASVLLGLLGPEIDDRSRRVGLPLASALDTQELATAPMAAVQRWTEPCSPRPRAREPGQPPRAITVDQAARPLAGAAIAKPPRQRASRALWFLGAALAVGGFAAGLGVVLVVVPTTNHADRAEPADQANPVEPADHVDQLEPAAPTPRPDSSTTPAHAVESDTSIEEPPAAPVDGSSELAPGDVSSRSVDAESKPPRDTRPVTAPPSRSPSRSTTPRSTVPSRSPAPARFPLADVDDPFSDRL